MPFDLVLFWFSLFAVPTMTFTVLSISRKMDRIEKRLKEISDSVNSSK